MEKNIRPILLRPVTSADEDFLFSVYASTRTDEMARVDWQAEQKESFLRMQFNAQRQYYVENYVGAEFQVILYKNELSGRLYIHHREKEIRIMDIALLPAFRNLGIGSSLIKDIIKIGVKHDQSVTIHVERFNPALHLYERLGFRQKEDKGVYWLMEWAAPQTEESEYVG